MPPLLPTVAIFKLLPGDYLLTMSQHRFQHALLNNTLLVSYEFSYQKMFLTVLSTHR